VNGGWLRQAICERFPPGRERRAWLSWASRVHERGLLACVEIARLSSQLTPGERPDGTERRHGPR
jgi:hypothetical protein